MYKTLVFLAEERHERVDRLSWVIRLSQVSSSQMAALWRCGQDVPHRRRAGVVVQPFRGVGRINVAGHSLVKHLPDFFFEPVANLSVFEIVPNPPNRPPRIC
jgi:hypothetical protein